MPKLVWNEWWKCLVCGAAYLDEDASKRCEQGHEHVLKDGIGLME